MLGEFLSGFRHRQDGILEEITSAVFRIGSHKRLGNYITPSARSLYTSTHRSQAPNSTSHPG
jgi:hypothetical protein